MMRVLTGRCAPIAYSLGQCALELGCLKLVTPTASLRLPQEHSAPITTHNMDIRFNTNIL